jgi:hypothetical protein
VGELATFAPVFKGGNDASASQSYFPAHHSEEPGPKLTSHFVSDLGKYRRAGGSSTPADTDQSLRRGRVSHDNVTLRETKRPSARPRDREYHQRFSVGTSFSHAVNPPPPPGLLEVINGREIILSLLLHPELRLQWILGSLRPPL